MTNRLQVTLSVEAATGKGTMEGKVTAVSADALHRFSKPHRAAIKLIAGFGVEGDAHGGALVKHRYLARRDRNLTNLRQIHLIHAELHDELRDAGFAVEPGDLGENITTRGIDLLGLPLGSHLHLGATAVVELTGLRTPCSYIDKFQMGLKRAMIVRRPEGGLTYKSGVMGVVRNTGDVESGDRIWVENPNRSSTPLPAI